MTVTTIYSPVAPVIKGRGPTNKITVATTEIGVITGTSATPQSAYDANLFLGATGNAAIFAATDDLSGACTLESTGLHCIVDSNNRFIANGVGIDGPVFNSPKYGSFKEKRLWQGQSFFASGQWKTGSLARHIEDQFVAMTAGKNPALASSVAPYSPTSFVAGYDLTGMSTQASAPPCLISARHAITAMHVGGFVNAQIPFRGVLGTIYNPRCTATNVVSSDLAVMVFDAPLPIYNPANPTVDGVVPFQVLPSNWLEWLPQTGDATRLRDSIEIITLPILNKFANYGGRFGIVNGALLGDTYDYRIPRASYPLFPWCPVPTFGGGLVDFGGDSGSPDFVPINGKLVLLGSHYDDNFSPFVSAFLPQLQAQMNLLAPGYSLSFVDLSSFPKYLTP